MKPLFPYAFKLGFLAATAFMSHAHAALNEFPTVERVNYVHECMLNHPGPVSEMTAKCSCALDKIAEQLSYDDYVTLSTDAKAMSIGGERGGVLRDNEGAQKDARRYRTLESSAKKACFIK